METTKVDLDSDMIDLDIPMRVHNVVHNLGIRTIRELLVAHTESTLLREPNFGKGSLRELKAALAEHGWKLRGMYGEPSCFESTEELNQEVRADVRLRTALRDLKSAIGRFEYELLNNKKIGL